MESILSTFNPTQILFFKQLFATMSLNQLVTIRNTNDKYKKLFAYVSTDDEQTETSFNHQRAAKRSYSFITCLVLLLIITLLTLFVTFYPTAPKLTNTTNHVLSTDIKKVLLQCSTDKQCSVGKICKKGKCIGTFKI
jgi:Na+/H+ antiporter NhaC